MAEENVDPAEPPQNALSQPAPGPDISSESTPPKSAEPVVVGDTPDEFEAVSALPFLVCGIGASAGGVEAYIELFSSLAPDTGIAFVLVPHLMPDQKSHMVEILSRHTAMPVAEIAAGSSPEPDHVYILPPGVRATLKGGTFHLQSRAPDGVPRSIDEFLRSLASDQKTRAVGIVLSGTNSDGALGLRAIKDEGGITMVQSPDSARFSEMPRSSISNDHVDRILAPAQIALELGDIGRQFAQPTLRILEEGAPHPVEEHNLTRILNLLRGASGIDFRLYKPSTIRRRVARRMLLHRIHTLAEYASFLQGNLKEIRELQEDALINVTHFFRDPAVFAALKDSILPRILQEREADQQIRIWVAGCSSGEEVYSIAIALLEFLTAMPFEPPIQIFGTDASDISIQKARTGIFPESISAEISPERLRRFFVKVDKGYQVSKRLRDLCIFARQNLCLDPPFSKMDLISCRNVLIYMGAELQKQILPTFHYALRPNGILLLGTSETIREFTDLFHLIDRKHKFFRKIGNGLSRAMMTVAPRLFLPDSVAQPAASPVSEHWSDLELQRAADRIVLTRYGPPGLVIDEKMEILQSRGHTSPFMEMPQGSVSLQLPRMLRESIASIVTRAVRHAIDQDLPVRLDGLPISDDDSIREITLEVLPIHTTAPRSKCFLVLFAPAGRTNVEVLSDKKESVLPEAYDKDQLIDRLRQDLASTKLYLQTLLEERDAKNQELVSANEEIQSSNEEMQSTNEELETTKEELQSSNEELQTVNDELQQRNTTLTQATNDLSNLLNSVNLPVLMLSNELHIRHFTPPTQKLMNLRVPDIGRPFSEIRMNLITDDLEPLFHEVLETLAPREMEVQDREGRWYLLRVRPYRTTDNKIEGVVVVLVDIDQLRRSELELRGARDFAQSVIESVPLPLAVVDLEFRIRGVNGAFRTLTGVGKEDVEKRSLLELAGSLSGLEEPLRVHLEGLRASLDSGRDFAFEQRTAGDNPRVFHVRGMVLKPGGENFLVTIEDITAHKEVARLLALERERLAGEVAQTARELGRTQDELRALAASLFTSQEGERRRVARELHDDICQKLAKLEIDIQQIESQISIKDLRRQFAVLRTDAGALSEEVRRISHALHPSVLEDLGLKPAIRSLVEEFRDREGMIVTFRSEGVPDSVPLDITTGLYRITQEALRNVSKHAGKTHVKVSLKGDPDRIRLQVADSGEGFDPHARRSGLGLISMEERARIMQGTLNVASEPGEGTRVTVNVPLPASQ
jgi:two-component system CheB/CheR fusion protein